MTSAEINSLNKEELEELVRQLQNNISEKDLLIANLTEQLQLVRHLRFARKTEQHNPNQMSLFDEAELPTPVVEESSEPEVIVKEHKRVRSGRKPLPKYLPRIEHIHELTENECVCGCGAKLVMIGEERSEQLELIPQIAYVIVHVKKKYACKTCESTVKMAKTPAQPIPKSIATAGTLAYIIDSKFNYHLPLYRLENILKRNQIEITRATLSKWLIDSANLLRPLVKLLHDVIINYDIAYADETELQVLNEPGRKATQKSRMWLFIGGPPGKRCFIYQYHPTREGVIAKDFFEDFQGAVHCDGYRGYDSAFKESNVKIIACWAHARRYFFDIVKISKKKKGLAHFAVEHINKLYKIETELRDNKATPDQIYKVRQQQSKPLLDEFHKWLEKYALTAPEKSLLSKAMNYCINHWGKLTTYIEDGRYEIDNNRTERSIKPFVIGRKNWLFHGNHLGADAGSILYSLIETCKEHQIDAFAYFKLVLSEVVNCNIIHDLEKLLPFNCDPALIAKQREVPDLIWPVKDAVN